MSEAVLHAPVQVHLPVDLGDAHLFLEGSALLVGDEGVIGSDAHQDLARYVGRVPGSAGGETRVKSEQAPDHGRALGGVLNVPGLHHGATLRAPGARGRNSLRKRTAWRSARAQRRLSAWPITTVQGRTLHSLTRPCCT